MRANVLPHIKDTGDDSWVIFSSYRMRDAESMIAMEISRVADAMIEAHFYEVNLRRQSHFRPADIESEMMQSEPICV
jgi:hypothetical protein